MKKFFAAIAIFTLTLGAANAVVIQPIGPVTCKWTILSQGLDFQLTAIKTNATATVTNVTTTYKSTVNKTNFNTGDLLTLVENSLKTNFPAGSQIALRVNHFFIVDHTGTNIQFDLGNLLTITLNVIPSSDVQNQKLTISSAGSANTFTDANVATGTATLNYNDSAFTPTDGTHTVFTLHGLITTTSSITYGAAIKAVNNIVFQTTGDGTLHNQLVVITGILNSKGKALPLGF